MAQATASGVSEQYAQSDGVPYRLYLRQDQIPTQWYNLRADMPEPPEPMRLPDGKVAEAADIAPVFCDALVAQELDDTTAYFDIPEGVQEMYKVYRPSPLCRAYNLERALGTPARIYYKFEGNNTSGSHKLNSAIAQAYYAKEQELDKITTETGAGQWGTALSAQLRHRPGLLRQGAGTGQDHHRDGRRPVGNSPFRGGRSFRRRPGRVHGEMLLRAEALPPIHHGNLQRHGDPLALRHHRNRQEDAGGQPELHRVAGHRHLRGGGGTAISEAVERALHVPENKGRYQLGSVLNQVLLHQSVRGLESYTALEELGEYPDIVIGCAGGGSNLGGLISPFMRDKLNGTHPDTRFVAVEPASCPSLTRGRYAYDFADTGQTCPLVKMYTLGNGFQPSPDHAGGLRYHGMSPIVSKLKHDGYMEAVAVKQTDVFAAAEEFARLETILPAPESAHAIYQAIQEAKACAESGEEKVILFGLTGTGYFDMYAYEAFNKGEMTDHVPTDEELEAGFATIPSIPGIQ